MMIKRTHIFRRVSVVGVGFIGGSISLAIKKNKLAREVVGTSRRHSSLIYSFKNKIIDRYATDLKKAVQNADMIVLCVPVKTMIDLLPMIGKHVKRGAIITDVGSTKLNIVEAAQKHLPSHSFFVGSHPLAGSEKKGSAWANADLFQNSMCIMTPTDKTNKSAQEKVKDFWTKIGANVKLMNPQEHDKVLAHISHLPHIAAYGLIEAIPDKYLEFAPPGLKDTTRIAASDPNVWSEICMENSKNLVECLDSYIKVLSLYRKSIVSKDPQNLIAKFKNSKVKRDGIS